MGGVREGVRGGLYFMHAFNPSSSDGKILSKKMDTVHLADASRNILVIQVWGGLEVSVIPCSLSCSLITHTHTHTGTRLTGCGCTRSGGGCVQPDLQGLQ